MIVGAPRSGTSLTEQMLSAHPEIYGSGEREIRRHLALVAGRTEGESSYLQAPERMDAGLCNTLNTRYMAELHAIDPAATYQPRQSGAVVRRLSTADDALVDGAAHLYPRGSLRRTEQTGGRHRACGPSPTAYSRRLDRSFQAASTLPWSP
ncbi:MAG: hypothetical protein GWP91_22180 [Rhodobacterales bacterium]|nr:hypothetical protein [Rhodobacterales bacterium]